MQKTTPRQGTAALFYLSGLVHASWMARLPALQNDLHANTAQLGLALAAMGAGTFVGMLVTDRMSRRIDGGNVVGTAATCTLMSLLWLSYVPTPNAFVLFMSLFGLFAGVWDAGMNVQASVLERRAGRHLMSGFHGLWSVGCVTGATVGVLAAWFELPVAHQCVAVAVVALVPCVRSAQRFLPDDRPVPPAQWSGFRVPPRRLRYLALIILFGAIIEGAASDWLAVLLVNGRGEPHEAGAAAYLAFVAAMAVGRLAVNLWCHDASPQKRLDRVISAGAVFTLAGIPTAILLPQPVAVYAGAACWGVGASVVFPVVLSVAAAQPDPGSTVTVLSSIGYGASMVGPVVLGMALLMSESRGVVVTLLMLCAAGIPLLTYRHELGRTLRTLPRRVWNRAKLKVHRPTPAA